MNMFAIFIVITLCLTYLSLLGYITGYFVLMPALRNKFGWKSDGKSLPWFDNFLYTENDLREFSSHASEPAVVSTLKLVKISEYSFLINFMLFLICLIVS